MAHSFATPTVLSLSSAGSAVMELRNHLNGIGPTRLPLLSTGTAFDLKTKIRVMEFQWQHRLKVDGVVGKKTGGHLSKTASTYPIPAHPSGRCIVVDLVNRVLHAYRDGVEAVTASPVCGGPSTHAGVFQMSSRRPRNHTSSTYPIPPGNMNFSLFFDGVKAIHQGPGSIQLETTLRKREAATLATAAPSPSTKLISLVLTSLVDRV